MVTDFLVVGGGIAGAAAGYHLAPHGRVTLLETEPAPGMHSTGRSAALFSEYYGGPTVRALTMASRPFYTEPPDGFGDADLVTPRGVIALAPPGEEAEFEQVLAAAATVPAGAWELDRAEAQRLCPVLDPGFYARAMLKAGACDIDVAATHQGLLRGIKTGGGQVVTDAQVRALRRQDGRWRVSTTAGEFAAPFVVNAAGAWADEVAAAAGVPRVGLVPRRRTAALVPAPPEHDHAGWPMILDVAETFYAKPESGALLLSPMDVTPMPPGSPRATDLDVALAVSRFEKATTVRVHRVLRSWAGLRSSVADDVPVIGEAPEAPGFFWHAAFGGYGIQTAPAAGRLLAGLVVGEPPPELLDLVPALSSARPMRTDDVAAADADVRADGGGAR